MSRARLKSLGEKWGSVRSASTCSVEVVCCNKSLMVDSTVTQISPNARRLDSSALMELMLLGKSVLEAEAEGKAHVEGDPAAAERLLDLYRLPVAEPQSTLAGATT